jgi:hypothetical protein
MRENYVFIIESIWTWRKNTVSRKNALKKRDQKRPCVRRSFKTKQKSPQDESKSHAAKVDI